MVLMDGIKHSQVERDSFHKGGRQLVSDYL
jgi:hypothetical protein